MPLFEFQCSKCQEKFEKLIFSAQDGAIECPKCKSLDIVKQFSSFNAASNSSSSNACGVEQCLVPASQRHKCNCACHH